MPDGLIFIIAAWSVHVDADSATSALHQNQLQIAKDRVFGEKDYLWFGFSLFNPIGSAYWSCQVTLDEMGESSAWSREQDKAFENGLATHPEDAADLWEKIAAGVPGKSPADVKVHYELLVEDVNGIESGRVPLPSYLNSSDGSANDSVDGVFAKKGGKMGLHGSGDSNHAGKGSKSEQERRKGIAWTEDEHRLFLLGLDKYGKGDWRSISRNFVVSRTPTQVASHAQKYFIRLNSINKDRRRSSIHDITSVNSRDVSAAQGPITGQANSPTGAAVKSPKLHQPAAGPTGVGMYGTTTIGQPVVGPLVSAVGTPVTLPAPSQVAYGMRGPVPGAIVPGAPVNPRPMLYPPMPHTNGHRKPTTLEYSDNKIHK